MSLSGLGTLNFFTARDLVFLPAIADIGLTCVLSEVRTFTP